MNEQQLVQAPKGYIWRWRTRNSRIAHLVVLYPAGSRYLSGMWSPCGKRISGDWRSWEVGGAGIQPCPTCAFSHGL